ncbi:MAG: sulfotransferase domain-containing protein [Dongiaceae bacterium]
MAKIIWIASYPRSGNTWLRFLLGNLIGGPIEQSGQLLNLIPDIHRGISALHLHGPRSTLIKTHWAWHPELPLREDTFGAIYLSRDPVEVLESNLRFHARRHVGDDPASAAERRRQWIDDYIENGGSRRWRHDGFGSWEENVASWTESKLPYPRLVLHYERLKSDPAGVLREIGRTLNLERSDDAIKAAIAASSVERLRAMEDAEVERRQPGIFYTPQVGDRLDDVVRFIGQNTAADASYRLTDDERARAQERFAPAMRRFGHM